MLLPTSVLAAALLAQSGLALGNVVAFPVDAGELVVPSSADVTLVRGEGLVVWSDARRDRAAGLPDAEWRDDVWALRTPLTPVGSRPPPGFLVCAAPRGSSYRDPRVASDGGEALIVWREETAGSQALRATVLHADGGALATCGRVVAGPFDGGLGAHRLAFGPDGYLLTWEEPHTLLARFVVPAELGAPGPVMRLGETAAVGRGSVRPPLAKSAVVGTSVGYLATWQQVGTTSDVMRVNVVLDGGPLFAPDASILATASPSSSSTLVARGLLEPVLLYFNNQNRLNSLVLEPATGSFPAVGASLAQGPQLLPGTPLFGAPTPTGVLAVFVDATGKLRGSELTFSDAGVPAAVPLGSVWGLVTKGADALVVGGNDTSNLASSQWANGLFSAPVVPLGVAPASQRQPSAAWTGEEWVLGWETVLPSQPLQPRANAAVLDSAGRLVSLHGIESARRWRGLSAQPVSHGLRAWTSSPLPTSAVSPMNWPAAGSTDFTVLAPMSSETVLGAAVGHASGEQVALLAFGALIGPEVLRVLPSGGTLSVDGQLGRCAASTAGKLWFAWVKGNNLSLRAVPDDALADPMSGPTRGFSLLAPVRGRPCVAANEGRLLVAVETFEGVETLEWTPETDATGPRVVLPPPAGVRLTEPVVASAPGGWVIVTQGQLQSGARAGVAHLVGHARFDDGSVSAPVLVSDGRSADEGNPQLTASGGKVLLSWERFAEGEGVVARSLQLVPPPDAGVDAGVDRDAGVDAGTQADAGVDAGTEADAGVDPTPVTFTSCGCSADGGLVLGLALAALALTRRRRH